MAEEKKRIKSSSIRRYVETNIWKDSKFQDLTINEKLLFLYALTNGSTNLCGGYEISKRFITFETGIETEELNKCFKTLENKNMLKYDNETNEMYVINFLKYNALGEKGEINAIKFYKKLKSETIKSEIFSYMEKNFKQPIDTLSIPYRYPIDDREKRIENREESIENSDKSIEISDKRIENREKSIGSREKEKEKKFEKGKGKGVYSLNNLTITDLNNYASELGKNINSIDEAYINLKKNNFISTDSGEAINSEC